MENKENFKFAELKIMFPNWSHGTIHNRIKFLKENGNIEISRIEPTTKKVFYNKNAVNELIELYVKEFPETAKTNFFDFENNDHIDHIDHIDQLNGQTLESVEVGEKKEAMEESFDQMEEKEHSQVGQNESNKSNATIPINWHNKIVEGLQKQIDILYKENERLSKQNDLLIEQHQSLIQNNETMARVIGVKEQTTLEEKREKRFLGTAEDNEKQSKWWQFWKK